MRCRGHALASNHGRAPRQLKIAAHDDSCARSRYPITVRSAAALEKSASPREGERVRQFATNLYVIACLVRRRRSRAFEYDFRLRQSNGDASDEILEAKHGEKQQGRRHR